MSRHYSFDFPITIPGIKVGFGISALQQADLWDHVPASLRKRLIDHNGMFDHGVDVSKADCDALPDDVWAFISQELGL